MVAFLPFPAVLVTPHFLELRAAFAVENREGPALSSVASQYSSCASLRLTRGQGSFLVNRTNDIAI